MAFITYGDRVSQVTSNTSGTVTLTLSSVVQPGFQSFAGCPTIGVGSKVEYTLEDANGIAWEQGEGTVGSNTLSRDVVYLNHLGTTDRIGLTAGTHQVFNSFGAHSAYRANPHLATPTITSGSLTIDLRSASDSVHRVTLNQSIVAGGITLVNAPTGVCRAHIQFEQATPSGTVYDVPAIAWPTNVLFVTEYQVYIDSTPTVVRAVTLDGGATYVAENNFEPTDYQPRAYPLDDLSTLSGAGILSITAGSLSTVSAQAGLPAGTGLVQVSAGTASTLSTATYQASNTTLSQVSTLSGTGLVRINAGTIGTLSTATYQASASVLSQLSTLSGSGILSLSAGALSTTTASSSSGGGTPSGMVIVAATNTSANMTCYFAASSTL